MSLQITVLKFFPPKDDGCPALSQRNVALMRFEIKTIENHGWAAKHTQKQLVNTPAFKKIL